MLPSPLQSPHCSPWLYGLLGPHKGLHFLLSLEFSVKNWICFHLWVLTDFWVWENLSHLLKLVLFRVISYKNVQNISWLKYGRHMYMHMYLDHCMPSCFVFGDISWLTKNICTWISTTCVISDSFYPLNQGLRWTSLFTS